MKHKQDAKKNADDIINAHQEIGLSLTDAQKSALITIDFMGRTARYLPCEDSLITRTQNYLRCLILGEEKALELISIETQIHKNYKIILFDSHNEKIKAASKENSELNKQILNIQLEWKKK